MAQAHKDVARRILEEVFSEGKLDAADELMAPTAVGHDPAQPEPSEGVDAFKQQVAGYRAAFPDIRMTVDDQVAEGDRVATRWTARGAHDGDLWGIAPTGKVATVTGITIDRFEGDRIAESWTNWDTFGLMTQLGVIPQAAHA